jgi:DNA polymerase-3 subunit chi
MVNRSSVVMSDDWSGLLQCRMLDVYLNLNHASPIDLANVSRLIEVVGSEEEDKMSARQRWKHYTQLGFTINRYDLSASNPA